MRLVTATGAGTESAGKIIAKLSSSAAFTTTKGDGNSLHLGSRLKRVCVFGLHAYAVRPAGRISAQGSGLYCEDCILLPAVAAKGKCLITDTWVLGAMDAKCLDFKVALLPFRHQTSGYVYRAASSAPPRMR